MTPKKIPPNVAKVFDTYKNNAHRKTLLQLRELVLETAAADKRIGPLTETLKWGDPAYLTEKTKAGSTVRLGFSKESEGPAVFVSCNTPLILSFQDLQYDDALTFVPPREISVPELTEENREVLQRCIAMTLTYHLDKKAKRKA